MKILKSRRLGVLPGVLTDGPDITGPGW
jgi:hypothetical protein